MNKSDGGWSPVLLQRFHSYWMPRGWTFDPRVAGVEAGREEGHAVSTSTSPTFPHLRQVETLEFARRRVNPRLMDFTNVKPNINSELGATNCHFWGRWRAHLGGHCHHLLACGFSSRPSLSGLLFQHTPKTAHPWSFLPL